MKLNGAIVMNGHHPARDFLKALGTKEHIAGSSEVATATEMPVPKPLPKGWDNVGGVIAEMMRLMVTTAKR
ncbi:MAG: hypothetical protein NTW47_22980 [Proteobacteria bacterium]|nr:hypothetical protein [Pseudomonadota bacterium]